MATPESRSGATEQGPLRGLRVLELAGIGPAPFCGMVLADLGADVVRVDRIQPRSLAGLDPDEYLGRGKRSIALDLTQPEGVAVGLRLVEGSDVLIEGLRPAVAERLGIGPKPCMARNPRLVYGRVTGWGQHGPLSQRAGHDINYIALSGLLDPIGRRGERPVPPLNLIGDFGGGGMLLLVGVLSAIYETARSGLGQVVDAAMVDGAALLGTLVYELRGRGQWSDARGTNLIDGGAPFYDTYTTADNKHVAIGALEPQFYAAMLELVGLSADDGPPQFDVSQWPELRARIDAAFRARTRDEWARCAHDADACVSPVLGLGEAPTHPHNVARGSFVEVDGVPQPAPAPRFSRTPSDQPVSAPTRGRDTDDVLREASFGPDEIADLRADGVVA